VVLETVLRRIRAHRLLPISDLRRLYFRFSESRVVAGPVVAPGEDCDLRTLCSQNARNGLGWGQRCFNPGGGRASLHLDDNVWSAAGLQGIRFGREYESAAKYSAFEWRTFLLAMMSSAACLSLQVGRSLETIIGSRLKARRCDCSFVLAVPVQTLVGKL
jgi:hypothetical protein